MICSHEILAELKYVAESLEHAELRHDFVNHMARNIRTIIASVEEQENNENHK